MALPVVQLERHERHTTLAQLPRQVADLTTVEKQLAGPHRLVFLAFPLVVGGMWVFCSPASPRSPFAYPSRSWTLPARIDLTSVPVSARPASTFSRMW